MFLPPHKLQPKSLDFIRRELEYIISRSSAQKSNVKLKSFGLIPVAKKSEVQDLLDSILKIAYPYISQARGLTDMNKQLEYSSDLKFGQAGLKFSLLPEALPNGYEDMTTVIIGFKENKKGLKSVVKFHMWRSGKFVWCLHKNAMFCKPISSESEPVNMEDAEYGHPGPFNVRAYGWTIWAIGSQFLGDYTLTEKEHRGRPVYKQSEEFPHGYLYSLESGAWGVSGAVGNSKPRLRSTTAASSPALCQHWQYSNGWGGPYKDGDITVLATK